MVRHAYFLITTAQLQGLFLRSEEFLKLHSVILYILLELWAPIIGISLMPLSCFVDLSLNQIDLALKLNIFKLNTVEIFLVQLSDLV